MNETIRENSTWSILYSTKTATLMNILYKNSNYEYKEPTVKKLQLQGVACTYCTTTEQLYWATKMRIPYKTAITWSILCKNTNTKRILYKKALRGEFYTVRQVIQISAI